MFDGDPFLIMDNDDFFLSSIDVKILKRKPQQRISRGASIKFSKYLFSYDYNILLTTSKT